MLHLKQTLHNIYTTSSLTISTTMTTLQSLGVVPQNLVLQENLGKMLLNLLLLIAIVLLTIVAFILSLLSLLEMILLKLKKLSVLTRVPGYNVQYTLCQWADAAKNTISTLKKLPKRVWKKDGDLPQDFTFHSSEMRGELRYRNKQHERAMTAPINYEKIRKEL